MKNMEDKQTAVEWLLEHDYLIGSTKWPDIVEKAKAMEKEQHGRTWDDALAQVEKRTVWAREMYVFDKYYKETYKK